MNLSIRKAEIKDVNKVLDLLKELKVSGYGEMGIKDVKVKINDNSPYFYRQQLNNPNTIILIAEQGENILGVAIAYLTPKILDAEYRMLVEEMVVAKDFRHQGVGSSLMKALEKEALNKQVKIIKVTTGTKLKANQFYRKHGYIYFENAYRKKLT